MLGDVRERLAELEPESVQCVVTSPPYWGLRDYKADGQLGLEATPAEYVATMGDVFRAVWRVLRRDGTLWLNLGDSYAGSGKGPSNNSELDRPYRGMSSLAAAPNRWLSVPAGIKQKDLIGIPWRVAFALQAAGWYLRSDIIWSKPNPMPESVTDRPTKAHEYLFLLTRSERYYYDAEAIRENAVATEWGEMDGGAQKLADGSNANAGRNYRASKKPDGWDTGPGSHGTIHRGGREAGAPGLIRFGRNKRSVWEVATQPYPEAHFATFPEALIEPCIKAGTAEGNVVLDPFAGSGTTLAVARRLGRRAIGIELQPDYLPLIQRRVMASAMPLTEAIRHIGEATA